MPDASSAAPTPASLSRAAGFKAEAGFGVLFAGLFLSVGAHIAFFPLWLEGRGMSAAEIGAVNAISIGVRILAGALIPALADATAAPKRVMVLIALAGGLAAALQLVAGTRLEIYALACVLAAAYAGLMPLSDAHAYSEATRRGFSYRRPRSVGSIAFIVATVALGSMIPAFGRGSIMAWIGGALALCALGVLLAPIGSAGKAPAQAAAPPHSKPRPRASLADWRALIANQRFLLFLAAIAALQSSHAVYYAFGSLHWHRLGWSDELIGGLWALGVVAEIVLFLFGGALLTRIRPTTGLALAGVLGLLRWGVMAFDPGLEATIALQILHAATFGVVHLSALAFISETIPTRLAASGQGLVSAVAGGIGMLLATIAATAIYARYDAAAYGLAAGLSAAGAAMALGLGAIRVAQDESSAKMANIR